MSSRGWQSQYATTPNGIKESGIEESQVPTSRPLSSFPVQWGEPDLSRRLHRGLGQVFAKLLIAFFKSLSESTSSHALQRLYRQCRPITQGKQCYVAGMSFCPDNP